MNVDLYDNGIPLAMVAVVIAYTLHKISIENREFLEIHVTSIRCTPRNV